MGRTGKGTGSECRSANIIVLDFKKGSMDFSFIPPRAVLRASPGPLGSRPGGFLFVLKDAPVKNLPFARGSRVLDRHNFNRR
jgi:hypothetical protein